MCLAQRHNTVTTVRLKPAAFRSQVKHSTTEPMHSSIILLIIKFNKFSFYKKKIDQSIPGLLCIDYVTMSLYLLSGFKIGFPPNSVDPDQPVYSGSHFLLYSLCWLHGLFAFMLYIPGNNFSVMSGWVFLG